MNLKIKLNGTDIPNNMILDKLEFSEDIGVNDFTVGKFILPTMKTKIHNDIEVKHGDVFTVYLDDEKYHTYEPYEIKKGNMSREITAYGMPYFALTQTYQPSTTNYTTRSLLSELQTALNIVVVGFQDIVAVDMPNVEPDTAINLLQAVAMLLQSNITINPHGEIEFTKINTTTTHEIAQSQITSIVKSDTTDYHITQITGRLSEDDENPIMVGTSANAWNNLTLINPYLTKTVCTNILSSLPQYSGFDIKIFNAPVIKPLDKIKFTYQGVEYIIPVMDITTSYSTGGLVTRIKANVSNANDKVNNYKGSLTTRLEVVKNITSELDTKITVIDGNIGTLINKTDVIEGDVTTVKSQYSQINQTIGEIDLRVGEVQTEISDKVSTNEIISSINLSTEGVKIKGDKIQLTGGTVVVGTDGSSMSLDEYLKAEEDSENFVLTPNFNSGSLSPNWTWSVGAFVYIDTTYKHGESTACRLKGSAGSISLNTNHISISSLSLGTTYKLSMWIYCTTTSSVTGEFQLCMYGKPSGATSNTLVSSLSFNGNNLASNKWTHLSFEFTPTQEYSTPSITVKGVSGSIDAWVTDFELVQKGESFTQEQLINIINGSGDGFYILDGQAYINAEYIQTGTMRADLIKVQVDGTSNLIPFNYVTLDNAINTTTFGVWSANDIDIPYLNCELPIFQGGASADVKCTQIGYSDVEIESGKDYYFMCEYYAVWGDDTKLDDGVGTSTATPTGGSKNGGLQNEQNMTLFLYNGDNPINAKNDGYYQLATVYDFNSSVKIAECEGYTGVYERTWTTLTARFTASQSYKGKLCINLDCSGFIYTGGGGSFYIRRFQLTDATQSDPVFIDYTKQVKEKHMELTDGSYYKNTVGVDGMQIENGYITGQYPLEKRMFEIDSDGFKCRSTTGSENAFVGVNQSYYSYDGGSSGQITGYDDIYGFGCREIVGGTSEGIFIGVHEGFQKPNSTDYGRADIYTLYKDGYAFDTHDWTLLGEKIEPKALVRRDDKCNIATNGLVIQGDASNDDFKGGTVRHGSVIFSEPLYSTTGNGQIINVHKDNKGIYIGNHSSTTLIETEGALIISDSQNGERQALVSGIQSGDPQVDIYTGRSIEIWADRDSSSTTERVWIGAGGNGLIITSSGTSQSFDSMRLNNAIVINTQNLHDKIYIGAQVSETGRNVHRTGVYCFNTWHDDLYQGHGGAYGFDGQYWTTLGWGCGTNGTAELAVNWTDGGNIIAFRSLRDTIDNWWNWKRIYHVGYQQTSTSDIRYKRAIADVDTSDCYDMVRNTQLHHYLLLDDTDELRACSEDGIEELETELDSEGYSRKVQMGIIAQDVLKYECGKYFVVQDINKDDDGNITSDKYSIDAYNYASAILGGLQEEIRIRDNQYEELKQENEELKQRLARIEAMLNQ